MDQPERTLSEPVRSQTGLTGWVRVSISGAQHKHRCRDFFAISFFPTTFSHFGPLVIVGGWDPLSQNFMSGKLRTGRSRKTAGVVVLVERERGGVLRLVRAVMPLSLPASPPSSTLVVLLVWMNNAGAVLSLRVCVRALSLSGNPSTDVDP